MRILMLSSWFPLPADNGSRIRAYNLFRTLTAKHEVTLLSFVDDDSTPAHANTLRALCREVVTVPRIRYDANRGRALTALLSPEPRFVAATYSSAMQGVVDERLSHGEIDLLFACQFSTAFYVRSNAPVPAIFDELELGIFHDAYANANGAEKWRRGLTWWKMARYVKAMGPRFASVTVVSERERQLATEIGIPDHQLAILPNAIDTTHYQGVAAVPEPNTLIYTGALTYSANLDAMRYFVHEILPRVRAAVPEVRLAITGRADQVAINELSGDNAVLFTGYLADVRPKIAASQVSIVPLRQGGGTRLKILEAMAVGTPVVATSKGVEGLDLVPGQDVLIGDTPDEFAAHIIALLGNPARGRQLAENAQAKVRAHYDWQQVGVKLDALVREAQRKN